MNPYLSKLSIAKNEAKNHNFKRPIEPSSVGINS